MAAPRVRFCPRGHDKDAPGGSYWSHDRNYKGHLIKHRHCAECQRMWKRQRYAAKVFQLRIHKDANSDQTPHKEGAPRS